MSKADIPVSKIKHLIELLTKDQEKKIINNAYTYINFQTLKLCVRLGLRPVFPECRTVAKVMSKMLADLEDKENFAVLHHVRNLVH